MRGIRDNSRKDNALPMTSGMSYSSRLSWRGVGNGVRKQTKRNDAHTLHDRSGMTGLVIPVPVKVKPIYTTTHSVASHVAAEQSVHPNAPSAASVLTGSGAQREGIGNQALRTTCNSSSALASGTGAELGAEENSQKSTMSSAKTKTRSWLSILTHDIPSLPPATAAISDKENPSVIKSSCPSVSSGSSNAAVGSSNGPSNAPSNGSSNAPSIEPSTAPSLPIPHVDISAAAPCKPVGRLARRPIGDNSYYRSDADLERERVQRQAYRDWVAMNEMAKQEMAPSRESLPTISLRKVDPPVGEQLETPLYLKPGEGTATTTFYPQNHGAVELEGEDYEIYMSSKRKWEGNQQARACSMCEGKRDLGVALEMYRCLLDRTALADLWNEREWIQQRASQLTIHVDCDHNHIKDNIFVNERAPLRCGMTPWVEARENALHCVTRRDRRILLLTEQKTRETEGIFG